MEKPSLPSTMRAWQYTNDSKGGFIAGLKLNTVPLPQRKPTQHLVQILTAALNPVDYKPAEIAILSRVAIPKPATPGLDFAGRILTPATGSDLKPGQLVFACSSTSPFAGGALREYATTELKGTVALPSGADHKDAATVGVGSLTAYQSIIPYVKPGDKVFINGGSGGTGVFGIQIAKVAGCHVITSCSTANIALCKSLGADEVIDYKEQPTLTALMAKGPIFDHVVDNVGGDWDFYWQCHKFTKPKAKFVYVGANPNLDHAKNMAKVKLMPGFMCDDKHPFVSLISEPRNEELERIGKWMQEGKVRVVMDETFAFEQVPEAFAKLKTGRTKGKVVVHVADA